MDDYSVETKNADAQGVVTVTPNGEKVPGGGTITHEVADKFFATRSGNLKRAFDDISTHQIQPDIDGGVLGKWVLTEISYWNRDKERIVVLCENCLLVCKYDFVAMKLGMVQRIDMGKVIELQEGQFEYPPNSVVIPRLYKGLRITWGSMQERPWYQKWNPLNTDIPFATFTSHPVFSLAGVESPNTYDVGDFFSSLKQALTGRTYVRVFENRPIIIESYAGVASYVHNQSRLGFSRERGGISF